MKSDEHKVNRFLTLEQISLLSKFHGSADQEGLI